MERSIEHPQPRSQSAPLLADKTGGSREAIARPSGWCAGPRLAPALRGRDR
jgi:hypothetical protein